jgi:hypothetical protein
MNRSLLVVILAVLVIFGLYLLMANNGAEVQAPTDVDTEEVVSAPQDSSAQGKLDINAVCEGALAYKTFPDGASADAFVADCKEGKYPEVIEEFKAQMGLGDGAAI